MPFVTVQMFNGNNIEQKRILAKKITDDICGVIGCPADAVTVRFVEDERENLARGGVLFYDKP